MMMMEVEHEWMREEVLEASKVLPLPASDMYSYWTNYSFRNLMIKNPIFILLYSKL